MDAKGIEEILWEYIEHDYDGHIMGVKEASVVIERLWSKEMLKTRLAHIGSLTMMTELLERIERLYGPVWPFADEVAQVLEVRDVPK